MVSGVSGLHNAPYLQIAFDITHMDDLVRIFSQVPEDDHIIIEVGTPLVKKHGLGVIRELRRINPNAFIVADLKTLDVGELEVQLAHDDTADAAVVSGLASKETQTSFIAEARRLKIRSFMDMMCVEDPSKVLSGLDQLPDVVVLHRGIDQEKEGKTRWGLMNKIREAFKGTNLLFAVAGGLEPSVTMEALIAGADIIVVGRYITQSKNVEATVKGFLAVMKRYSEEFKPCLT
jgi:bifunctional enzyme Fae/Hps